MHKIKKSIFLYITINFLLLPLFAESDMVQTGNIKSSTSINIESTIPNWVVVLTGKVLCEPVKLGYGFVVMSEGNVLTAFSQDGKILRQSSMGAGIKPYMTSTFSDMLYLVTKAKTLSLLNPLWKTVWSSQVDFNITHTPIPGRDGRVFVYGNNSIACIDTAGTVKWTQELSSINKELEVKELNDGSLLVFTNALENNCTTAIRLSPFGKKLEKLTFDGKVSQCMSCSDGVLVAFEDGSAGLCSVQDKKALSKWRLNPDTPEISKPTYISSMYFNQGNALLISGSPAKISLVKTADGQLVKSFDTASINTGTLHYAFDTTLGILLADSKNACLYSNSGSLLWSAYFPSKNNYDYLFATDTGYLSLCQSNWVIQSYRMKQAVGNKKNIYQNKKSTVYSDYYFYQSASSELTGQLLSREELNEMHTLFKNGNIAEKEEYYLNCLDTEMQTITNTLGNGIISKGRELSFFEANLNYTEEIISLAAESNSLVYYNYFSNLLRKVTDSSLLPFIVKITQKCSYDPEKKILSSLDFIIKNRANPKDTKLLQYICDTTYAICACMGKPAFFSYGKEILSSLLYPQYDANTREYARNTLSKINKLSM